MEPDTNDNETMKRLTKPLFEKPMRKRVSVNDVNTPILYAVTVNPQPTCKLNRKRYNAYSGDQQVAILSRIEAALRRKNPDITLVELRYEICPKLQQWHFHALYEMAPIYLASIWNYYKRIMDSTDANTKTIWRYLDIQPVWNKEGWEQYIRKDAEREKTTE